MKLLRHKLLIALLLIIASPTISHAQCAMCRAVLQTTDHQGAAEGINHGIIYLMIFPYLIVGILGFSIYRILRKGKSN